MKISTPCIGICVLDENAGLCSGCGRTRHEIAAWSTMTEPARRTLMEGLPARLAGLRSSQAREADSAHLPGRS